MAANVDRAARGASCADDQSPIDAAELARLRRVDALARRWAETHALTSQSTSRVHFLRAERALLNEVRRET